MYFKNGQYLRPEECEPGYLYRLQARNAPWGIWLGLPHDFFIIRRYKFGMTYLDCETHYDLDPHYGTAQPLIKMHKCIYDLDFLKRFPNFVNCNPNDVANLKHWLGIQWIDPLPVEYSDS